MPSISAVVIYVELPDRLPVDKFQVLVPILYSMEPLSDFASFPYC